MRDQHVKFEIPAGDVWVITEPRAAPWKLATEGNQQLRLWESENLKNIEATLLGQLYQDSEIVHNRGGSKVRRKKSRKGFQRVP